MSELFRYIHLTDFHFCRVPNRRNAQYLWQRQAQRKLDTLAQAWSQGAATLLLPTSYVPDIAKGVAQFCFENRHVADGIIITGDLATTAIPTDLAVASAFLKELPSSGFMTGARMATLAASRLPIYVMAGNHDRYDGNSGKPGSNLFDLTFDEFLRPIESYVGGWVSEKNGEKLGFVYADFSLRERVDAEYVGPVFAYGQGRVYEDVFEDLKTCTHRFWQNHGRIPIIWLVHYAPFPCSVQLKLVDFERIQRAAGEMGILATLCGHTHRQSKHQEAGHTIYCGGSACCSDSDDNCTVHLIEVRVGSDASVVRKNFKWSYELQEFQARPAD